MANQVEFQKDQSAIDSSGRHYYLDWLRVIAILFVFFVHASKIFDYHTTVVFNAERSYVFSAFREFSLVWVMPFFFVVSGAAVFLSSRFQGTGGFLKSRVIRLLIPAVLVGTFIVNPPYVYIEKLFSGKTVSGFFNWYPQFFDGFYLSGKGNFAPWGLGTHMWYLQMLFIYSLILLPLFIRSKKSGLSILGRLSSGFKNPWALFLLFMPMSAIAAALEYNGIDIRVLGNWDPISYILFFAFGYLIFFNPQIQETIKKYNTIYLVVALIISVLYVASHFGVVFKIQGVTRHDLATGEILPLDHSIFAIVQAVRGLLAWCWTLALLGLGRRVLNFNNKFRTYANEAVLPFYILHHSVIYGVGFYVIQWGSGVGLKFIIISILSFAGIMAIYEILVRRVNILRILFGIKSKNRAKLALESAHGHS